jgi:hypothetical protein
LLALADRYGELVVIPSPSSNVFSTIWTAFATDEAVERVERLRLVESAA